MLLVGLLASEQVNPLLATTYQENGTVVSLAGSTAQFLNQAKGVAFTAVFAGLGTFLIVTVVRKLVGLRVSEEEESAGLDLTQHGENAYND